MTLMAGVLSIIASNTSDHERPTYIGLAGAMWGLASVLGPVLGGAFTASAGGWRWVITLLFILLTAVILYKLIDWSGHCSGHDILSSFT